MSGNEEEYETPAFCNVYLLGALHREFIEITKQLTESYWTIFDLT